MKWLFLIVIVIGPLAFSGESVKPAIPPANSMKALDDTAKLKAGDWISFSIFESQERPMTLRITGAEDINCPYLGPVKAAGLSPKALSFEIKKGLEASYFLKATVSTALIPAPAPAPGPKLETDPVPWPSYTIFGDVARQGRYEIPAGKKVMLSDALIASGLGGIRPPTKVKIHRKGPEGKKVIEVNVRNLSKEGKENSDIPMQDGDVIVIPEKWINF